MSQLTLDAQRHLAQDAFLASGQGLVIGSLDDCPLPPAQLTALTADSPYVVRRIESGLTAYVFQIRVDGRDYALKQARLACLVQNQDGQTSFLNELQRRADIAALTAAAGGFSRIIPALYGALAEGIIVSPWVQGRSDIVWDERTLTQVFDSGRELVENGLFEWDYCPGNLIDDGRQVWLFDFGYNYRFDPLTQFNSAGHGDDVPMFHLAERFETRNFFAYLLTLEQTAGQDAALAAFRQEKRVALATYERLRANLVQRGAVPKVLGWLDGIMAGWRAALAGDLAGLYLKEGWRSHHLDLDDDLRGQTCTPRTLVRCNWLLATLAEHFDALVAEGTLLHADVDCDRATLLTRYQHFRAEAQRFQIVFYQA
jgi:hypothetical protein